MIGWDLNLRPILIETNILMVTSKAIVAYFNGKAREAVVKWFERLLAEQRSRVQSQLLPNMFFSWGGQGGWVIMRVEAHFFDFPES